MDEKNKDIKKVDKITVPVLYDGLTFCSKDFIRIPARGLPDDDPPTVTTVTEGDMVVSKKTERKYSFIDNEVPYSESEFSLDNMKEFWKKHRYFCIADIVVEEMKAKNISNAYIKLVITLTDEKIDSNFRQSFLKLFLEDLKYNVEYEDNEYTFRIVDVELIGSGNAIMSNHETLGTKFLCHFSHNKFVAVKYINGVPDPACYTIYPNDDVKDRGNIYHYLVDNDLIDENRALHILSGYYKKLTNEEKQTCEAAAKKIAADLKESIKDLGYTGAEEIIIFGSGAKFMKKFSSISQAKNVTLIEDCRLIANGAERVSEARSSYLLDKAACF